jgi:hypothetical protein
MMIVFKEVIGTDKHLDSAINYYLDLDDEDEDDWEEDE